MEQKKEVRKEQMEEKKDIIEKIFSDHRHLFSMELVENVEIAAGLFNEGGENEIVEIGCCGKCQYLVSIQRDGKRLACGNCGEMENLVMVGEVTGERLVLLQMVQA